MWWQTKSLASHNWYLYIIEGHRLFLYHSFFPNGWQLAISNGYEFCAQTYIVKSCYIIRFADKIKMQKHPGGSVMFCPWIPPALNSGCNSVFFCPPHRPQQERLRIGFCLSSFAWSCRFYFIFLLCFFVCAMIGNLHRVVYFEKWHNSQCSSCQAQSALCRFKLLPSKI